MKLTIGHTVKLERTHYAQPLPKTSKLGVSVYVLRPLIVSVPYVVDADKITCLRVSINKFKAQHTSSRNKLKTVIQIFILNIFCFTCLSSSDDSLNLSVHICTQLRGAAPGHGGNSVQLKMAKSSPPESICTLAAV